jgi:hypothetical protein
VWPELGPSKAAAGRKLASFTQRNSNHVGAVGRSHCAALLDATIRGARLYWFFAGIDRLYLLALPNGEQNEGGVREHPRRKRKVGKLLGLPSVEKDDSSDQLDGCERIQGEFVVAGRNGSKVLNFVEEALDEVALAVKCEIAIAFGLSVGFGGNYGRDFSLRKAIDERISVVGLVSDQGFRIGIFNRVLGASQIVDLP